MLPFNRIFGEIAHLTGEDDDVVSVKPLLDRVGDWKKFLDGGLDEDALAAIRSSERTGHALGTIEFLKRLGEQLGKNIIPRKPGRPKSPN